MNSLAGGSPLFTLLQAADYLNISKRTLHRLIASGDLPPPLKIGRSSRIHRDDVDSYLTKLRGQDQPNGGDA